MINYYRFAVRHSSGAIRTITAPALVIWGERDRYLGPTLAQPHHEDVPNLDRVERPGGPTPRKPGASTVGRTLRTVERGDSVVARNVRRVAKGCPRECPGHGER
jgi:pimeloyl-ACP methyl ester carboxylesterase